MNASIGQEFYLTTRGKPWVKDKLNVGEGISIEVKCHYGGTTLVLTTGPKPLLLKEV